MAKCNQLTALPFTGLNGNAFGLYTVYILWAIWSETRVCVIADFFAIYVDDLAKTIAS